MIIERVFKQQKAATEGSLKCSTDAVNNKSDHVVTDSDFGCCQRPNLVQLHLTNLLLSEIVYSFEHTNILENHKTDQTKDVMTLSVMINFF